MNHSALAASVNARGCADVIQKGLWAHFTLMTRSYEKRYRAVALVLSYVVARDRILSRPVFAEVDGFDVGRSSIPIYRMNPTRTLFRS
jgi:hypothetical protein